LPHFLSGAAQTNLYKWEVQQLTANQSQISMFCRQTTSAAARLLLCAATLALVVAAAHL
jgi:hypothetical protein